MRYAHHTRAHIQGSAVARPYRMPWGVGVALSGGRLLPSVSLYRLTSSSSLSSIPDREFDEVHYEREHGS